MQDRPTPQDRAKHSAEHHLATPHPDTHIDTDMTDSTSTSTRTRSLTDMPVEVLMEIALDLPCREFSRFIQTNKTIFEAVNSHYIWHQRFITRFGQTILEQRLDRDRESTKRSSKERDAGSRPSSPRFPEDSNTNSSIANINNNINTSGTAVGGGSNTGNSSSAQTNFAYPDHHNHQDPSSSSGASSSASSLVVSSLSNTSLPEPAAVEEARTGGASNDQGHDDSNSGSESDSDSDTGDDGEGSNENDVAAAAKRCAKGKGRKVDLRKTTEAPMELLIELYKRCSRMTLPAEDMAICHMGDRFWKMIESRSSTFGKLAQLLSVWWMDVAAVIYGVPPGRYKVQWRVKVTSDAPIVNSEFKAVLFDRDEDQSVVSTRPDAVYFKPRNIQEFMEHTDSQVAKADHKPFRNLFKKGFTTLELPGELIVEDDFKNVFFQIRNYEGWKAGLYIDYVRLVDLDDPEKSKVRVAPRSGRSSAETSEEDVNDDGEEYYPSSSSSTGLPWLQSVLGINPDVRINPLTYRSRAFRHYDPVDSSVPMNVGQQAAGASGPGSGSGTASGSTAASGSAAPAASRNHPRNRSQLDANGQPKENPNSWYMLYVVVIVYCLYIFWTQ